MKKDNSKPASVLIATLALTIGISGCSKADFQTGAFTGTLSSTTSKELIGIQTISDNIQNSEIKLEFEPIVASPSLETTFEEKMENSLQEEYNDLISYCKYLDSVEPLTNLTDILLMPENYSKEDQALAAFQNLKKHGLTITDVLSELDNILVYSQYPTCCDVQTFEALVGKLHKTLNYCANPFSSYHVLAQNVHEFTCEHEHTSEYGIYTCKDLQIRGEEVRPLTLEEYLDKNLPNNYGFQKIKDDLTLYPERAIEDYLPELENLIRAQLTPTEIDEESWLNLFGKLLATLDESESLYETYIDLAVYIHNMLYPEDILVQDEYGIYTSDTLKHKKA